MTDLSRQAVYQGLLAAIGRYFYHEAHTSDYEERVVFDSEEPYKPIIDWVMEGDEPIVSAFHVWGVGGGRGSQHSYDYCKDRRIVWDADDEAWVVKECQKYVINASDSTPSMLPTAPGGFEERRRIQV